MILITGATGLVGSYLALQLIENGEAIRGLYRNENSLTKVKSLFKCFKKEHLFETIDWYKGDITNIVSLENAFENISTVYHCAGLISFDPREEENLRKTNIEGTANVINFALAKKVKKVCHVSSIACLGETDSESTWVTEQSIWNPEQQHSDYALSKFGAEMEVFRGQQEGLDVVILNPGIILGAGYWDQGSGKLFSEVKKGMGFYTKGITGFVSVNDVVKLLVLAMKNSNSGERYIAVSENKSYQEIQNIIANALSVEKPSKYAAVWLTEIAWRLDWIRSLLGRPREFSKFTAKSCHEIHLYSNDKAIKNFDYEFQSINDSISEIVQYQNRLLY